MNAIASIPRHTFGQIVRIEREKQGLSHRDIATRCGVDKELVKQWETDAKVPDRFQLKKLFGSCQRLRHYVHLLPHDIAVNAERDALTSGEALPAQLAPIINAETPPRSFGEGLRRLRLREGLAQEEVAELIGVTGSAVSSWETDDALPIVDHYLKLEQLFPDVRKIKSNHRDIEKPAGRGDQMGTTDQAPQSRHPTPSRKVETWEGGALVPAQGPTLTPKQALIRWGGLFTRSRRRTTRTNSPASLPRRRTLA